MSIRRIPPSYAVPQMYPSSGYHPEYQPLPQGLNVYPNRRVNITKTVDQAGTGSTIFKWILVLVLLIGVGVGAYFLYTRLTATTKLASCKSKDDCKKNETCYKDYCISPDLIISTDDDRNDIITMKSLAKTDKAGFIVVNDKKLLGNGGDSDYIDFNFVPIEQQTGPDFVLNTNTSYQLLNANTNQVVLPSVKLLKSKNSHDKHKDNYIRENDVIFIEIFEQGKSKGQGVLSFDDGFDKPAQINTRVPMGHPDSTTNLGSAFQIKRASGNIPVPKNLNTIQNNVHCVKINNGQIDIIKKDETCTNFSYNKDRGQFFTNDNSGFCINIEGEQNAKWAACTDKGSSNFKLDGNVIKKNGLPLMDIKTSPSSPFKLITDIDNRVPETQHYKYITSTAN